MDNEKSSLDREMLNFVLDFCEERNIKYIITIDYKNRITVNTEQE